MHHKYLNMVNCHESIVVSGTGLAIYISLEYMEILILFFYPIYSCFIENKCVFIQCSCIKNWCLFIPCSFLLIHRLSIVSSLIISNASYSKCRQAILCLGLENLAEGVPVITPFKEINRIFTTLYGIITSSMTVNYSCARYNSKCNSKLLYTRPPLPLLNPFGFIQIKANNDTHNEQEVLENHCSKIIMCLALIITYLTRLP